MWNPETNRVVTTRDVIWLKRMYFDPSRVSNVETFSEPLGSNDVEAVDDVESANDTPESATWEGVESNVPISRFGHAIKPVNHLIETIASMIESDCSVAIDLRYLECFAELDNCEVATFELSLVGAGVGGGFSNTNELKVLNFRQAMKGKDAEEWLKEVKNEKKRFNKYNALTPVPRSAEGFENNDYGMGDEEEGEWYSLWLFQCLWVRAD